MMIHDITVLVGPHKKRMRVGRGMGSGKGRTCGRGHNGAGSRSGSGGSIRAGREGGQMPLFRRFPKRGFSNAQFRKLYHTINIKVLEARFDAGADVTAESLAGAGLIPNTRLPVKILGEGALTKKLNVTAAAYSASAKQKITDAGGAANVA